MVWGHCGRRASNNPASTRRFCNNSYFFSSAPSLPLGTCVSLQDKRIVLKVGCSDITLLSSSPNIFHFSFSRCCFWVVVTQGEMPAVSPRMSETSLEMMRSLRSVLLKYQKRACLSSWERKSFGAWRRSSDCAPSHQIQSHWEVWGPSWAWVFSKVLVAFEHVLSGGQKVLTPFLVFSMEGLSECYKEIKSQAITATKKFIIGRWSWGFCPVGLTGDEILKSSLESLYFQHLIMKIFTTQRKPLKQSWMHILASSCFCTHCLFRELSFGGWGNWVGNCEKGREYSIDG